MDILLVKPLNLMSDHIQPPIGLAYLAAMLAPAHHVEILDMMKAHQSRITPYLKGRHYDVIGLQCYTQDLNQVKNLVEEIKRYEDRIITVVGGPHPTMLPLETAGLSPLIDFVLRGEAEYSLLQLVNELQKPQPRLESIPGLIWRRAGEVVQGMEPALVDNLDDLPLPAWHLLKPETYPPAQHGAFFEKYPIAPMITTRGCPYGCRFCSAPVLSGKKVRTRSQENIIREILLLYRERGIREFHIVDDNFSIKKVHAKKVLQAIIDLKLDLSLAFPNGIRIETVDDELLDLMSHSGVYLISLGIEAGTDRVLKLIDKHLAIAQIREKIGLIHRHRIDMAGFFVIGYPGEQRAEIEQTIAFSLELPLIRANYFDFLPLPGTPVFEDLRKRGELQALAPGSANFTSASYAPEGMTRAELKQLQRKAFLKFYLRPKVFLKNISKIKSLKHLKYLAKRFYHWILMAP